MAKNKFYRPIIYGLLIAARSFFTLLPFRASFAFCGFLGRLAFKVLPKERKKTLMHLEMAFGGERSAKELEELGEKVFQNYGYLAAEINLIHKIFPHLDEMITVEGKEHFERALAQGKGISAVGAHFGNWEMMAGYLSLKWFPGSVLARRIYYEPYNKLLLEMRERMKLKTIYRDQPAAAREVLKAFRENRVVGFVADQDVETIDGVFVDFFGRPAFSPAAPAKFALKTGAPLITLFMIRKGLKHHMIIEPPLELTVTGDEKRDIQVNTQKWVSMQERYIRRYPELWVWNHKRWKTRQNGPISVSN